MNPLSVARNKIIRAINVFNFFKVGEKSAALAYYALFALSPILILITSIAGFSFFGSLTESGVHEFFVRYFGPQAENFFEKAIQNTPSQSLNAGVTVVGFLLVFYGAINFFRAIQTSLFELFSVSIKDKNTVKNYFLVYLYSLVYLFIFLFFIIVLFASQFFLTISIDFIEKLMAYSVSAIAIRAITAIIILGLLTLFLGVSYRLFSRKTVGWDEAFIGGFAASILVLLLNKLLELYFIFSKAIIVYGAASFLVAILLWIYLFSMILFSGALVARYASKV